MYRQRTRIRIGLRTIKTVAAVVISMSLVSIYGATTSKLIFAMLGAMAAVQPTFKDSLESCMTQIVGVLFGALAGMILLAFPLGPVAAAGIGIALVIVGYNALGIRFSPSLPCFVVVMLCTTPDATPFEYALGRIWDSTIGLGVGMAINTLIFPYDNRREIQSTMVSLDRELIAFLEELFDGDDIMPDSAKMRGALEGMDKQLKIFASQRLLMRPSRQRRELSNYRSYEEVARRLVAHMEVLCNMSHLGRLNGESRRRLRQCGANITDRRELIDWSERDAVTNYHLQRILDRREELLELMEEDKKYKKV